MGFYSSRILPTLMDWAMANPTLAPYRQAVLADVAGDVLEIGFGSGLNLAYYTHQVNQLTAIDANPGMARRAEAKLEATTLTVEQRVLNGESLPFADGQFDYVVSTWTLCSIARVHQALAEISRVLKPGGRFVFVEHGLSEDPKLQIWQHRLTPLQKIIADGCHLDRDIQALVTAHFPRVEVERTVATRLPAVGAAFYRGTAYKTP
ncbi:MAG: class I SAM-dependent methyltransferase [Nodosilinea sp.]